MGGKLRRNEAFTRWRERTFEGACRANDNKNYGHGYFPLLNNHRNWRYSEGGASPSLPSSSLLAGSLFSTLRRYPGFYRFDPLLRLKRTTLFRRPPRAGASPYCEHHPVVASAAEELIEWAVKLLALSGSREMSDLCTTADVSDAQSVCRRVSLKNRQCLPRTNARLIVRLVFQS